MKIEAAINHAEEVASRMCDECGKQHRQLASWLKELVRVRAENAKLKAALEPVLEIRPFAYETIMDGGKYSILRTIFRHSECEGAIIEAQRIYKGKEEESK